MKTTRLFLALSLVAVLALSAGAAFAKPSDDDNSRLTAKLLITNLNPGDTVALFVDSIPFPALNGTPPGSPAASARTETGGVMELFTPIGHVASLYRLDPQGPTLIAFVSPTGTGDILVDARGPQVQQYADIMGTFNRGLASPMQPSTGGK